MIINKDTKVYNIVKHYKTKGFNKKYNYNGELGAIYESFKTTFKVWSPISTKIVLRIYENGTPSFLGGDDQFVEYEMMKKSKGVWVKEIQGDLEGKYYTYVVSNFLYENKEVVDPYAKSAGINGLRGMVVDFSKTNPIGWDDVEIIKTNYNNLTVYESHIADLTNSDTWNGNKANYRLFNGFYEDSTTYNGVSTGFNHIKELGVNAVQILPMFDHTNDEVKENRVFNWGYNPLNYNVIEGSYSSNPYDGYVRIKEFKELVMAYNKAGINIIMDVVYNHVNAHLESNFDVLMPYYYYRYNKDGRISDGSGCGNETASDMPMFKKFMIDSTEFLAKEYKLYGYRFDLMGVHNIETMNDLAANLHKNVNENIVVYGEPWSAGPLALDDKYVPAMQSNMALYEGYGCFNDKVRDALIKGGLNSNEALGWVTNDKHSYLKDYRELVKGVRGYINYRVKDRSKTVTYATCHDNFTLYDRIKAAGINDCETVKKMAMLANSVVLTSDGIGFMLSGEELLRTKNGNDNSYNSSYEENEINYDLKIKHIDMFNNYKKLINFKKTVNFNNIKFRKEHSRNVLVYDIKDEESEYLVIHKNGVAEDLVLDLSGYELYLDTLNIYNESTSLNNIKIEKYQSLILKKC